MAAGGYDEEMRERVNRILRQILESDRLRESSAFSERSYGDEPILRTGADLRRDREEREELRRQARERQGRQRHARPSRGEAAHRPYESQARPHPDPPGDVPSAPFEGTSSAPASAWDWVEGWRGHQASPRKVELPETLRRLRDVQAETDADGARLTGNELFVRQARVAADYEDDFDDPRTPAYRYGVSYRDLTDAELRDYFSWRTLWRRGQATRMPFSYVRIAAAELVNGVGAEPGEPTLRELQRLERDSLEGDERGMGPNVASDLRQWTRDYAIYHQLDPGLFVSGDERAFAEAVATLRLAERDVLAREGLRDLKPANAPAQPPTDEQLWQAMGAVSNYPLARSPFFRTHEEESAHVGAGVFRRLAHHCAKRRKTLFVDGIVGWEDSRYYTPFLGLPFVEEQEPPDMTVRVSAAETVSHRFGRWRVRRGYERISHSRDLGRILKAIDRQMRREWDFGRQLKGREIPKYLDRMIVAESTAEHERVVEAESRRITIDLSQLGHIRSAAAKTREALLVDEEREGFVPAEAVVAPPATAVAVPTPPAKPEPEGDDGTAQGMGGAGGSDGAGQANPLGLSDLELSVMRRLLDGRPIDDLLGRGAPMASVLVDGINERFFDEIGDSVVEFDDGTPRLVEDYADDVRDLLS